MFIQALPGQGVKEGSEQIWVTLRDPTESTLLSLESR